MIFLILATLMFIAPYATMASAPTTVVADSDISYRTADNQLLAYYKGAPFSGTVIQKYANGTLKKKISFKRAKAHGTWRYWYKTGAQKGVTQYQNGLPHGVDSLWYSDGQLRQKSLYRKGLLNGKMVSYSKNGEKSLITSWDHGNRVR